MVILVRVESPHASGGGELAFKNPERIVIGRHKKSDVRLPDPTVSQRHASIRRRGAGYVVVDEHSSNGTFVNHIRLATGASHALADGDLITIGREVLSLRFAPDGAASALSTQDLALALVQGSLLADGADTTLRLSISEGPDRGRELVLDGDRTYVIGRDATCDLVLADEDASRRHTRLVRRGPRVWVSDLGSKNGTRLDGQLLGEGQSLLWQESCVLEIGQNKLSLSDPISAALRALEDAPDERLEAALGGPVAEWTGPTQSLSDLAPSPNLRSASAHTPSVGLLTPTYAALSESRPVASQATSTSSSAPSGPIEPPSPREEPQPPIAVVAAPRRWSSLDALVVSVAVLALTASVLALAWFLTG